MKPAAALASLAITLASMHALVRPACAQGTVYWDINGATPGAGGTAPTGTWNATNTNWSSSAAGDVATAAWTAGNTAVFAAGTDATGAYTVTVDGTQDIGGVTFQEGTVTLSGGGLRMVVNSTFDVAAERSANISSTISDDGTARRLTKTGAGTLTLSGENTYTGGTSFNGGVISVSDMNALGTSGTLVFNGGTLQFTGSSGTSSRSFTSTGVSVIDIPDGGSLTRTGQFAGGSGGIRKTGAGTLNIDVTSSDQSVITPGYGGDFAMTEGYLNFKTPSLNFSRTNASSPAKYSQSGGTTTLNADLRMGVGTVTKNATFTITGGSFTQSSGITFVGSSGGANSIANLNIGGGPDTAIFTAPQVRVGATNFVSTLALKSNGILVTGVLDTGSGTKNLVFDGGTLKVRAGTTDGSTLVASGFTSAQIRTAGAVFDTDGINVTIAQGFADYTGEQGGLTKAGVGTLTFSGVNTYTGATTISAGTLALGSAASLASPVIDVASGGRLDVSALTGGLSLGTGQRLGGRGTLLGDVTFGSGSQLAYDPLGPLVVDSGTLTFAADFGVANLFGIDWDSVALNTPFPLISTSQTTFGDLANFGFANRTSVGSIGRQAYFESGSLQVVVVPEPATSPLVAAGLIGLVVFGWRQRK